MSETKNSILAGIDTGGTFTDLVVMDGERMRHCKVLSTPEDPSRSILEGLDRLGVVDAELHIVHGTTVGTNAVLEGKGARVAYVTSRGFADVLALGRQNRAAIYSLRQPEQAPPVPDDLCFEVSTRAAADGSLLAVADDREIDALRARLEALAPESVAINLLFSFLCPAEEERIARALEDKWFVSRSSKVLPEIREYERGIATWLDASVGPVIGHYLSRLAERLPAAKISVMQCSGTTVAAAQAAAQAVRLLLSGPAGGISAARLLGKVTGQEKLLTFDMGGTSTDVSLLDGKIPLTNETRIGNWPLTVPSVDIHTIGAGGGSIARVDSGGLLLVGPESAGADPGPACYGQSGEQVTVTDANLVLGRIHRDTLLGGYLPLDVEAADTAMDRLALELSSTRLDAARGVIRVANEHMTRALRVMSVERGHDPRDYALVSFGGAGGLHACELADLLEAKYIILPARAGVFSALGMLASEPGRELSRAVLKPIAACSEVELQGGFQELEAEAACQMAEEGIDESAIGFQRRVEMRYFGQSAAIVLDFESSADHAEVFHTAHQAACGHRLDREVELANLRLGARSPAPLTRLEAAKPSRPEAESNTVYMADLGKAAAVIERRSLGPGAKLAGPAIITETSATAWLAPGWGLLVDQWGNLVMERSP